MKSFLFIVLLLISYGPAESQSEMLVMHSRKTVTVMGMGGSEVNITTWMNVIGSREDKKGKATGMMAMMSDYLPTENGVSLIRLDKKLGWNIDSLGECRETTLSAYIPGKEDTSMAKYEIFKTAESKKSDSIMKTIEWVTTTDSSDTVEIVNGYPCRLITCRSAAPDSAKSRDEMIFSYKLWYSSEAPGADIYQEYQTEYNRLTGFDNSQALAALATEIGPLGAPLTNFAGLSFSARGIPIKTVMEVIMPQPDSAGSENIADSSDSFGKDDPQIADMMTQMAAAFKKMIKSNEDGTMTVMTTCIEYFDIRTEESIDSLFAPPPACEE
ncbi:MAG: hypothetical protein CVT49_10380 [candidate division Zixibacteria bacterium HGW-Zixibacteria-1]|nr:MAG: hypothetical protein CVT49_10380 [candidate division Zixibacteria bacterium HGW-Zixibacteria-1]